MTEAFQISGDPTNNNVLIVADHASNIVPPDIDLGIPLQYLEDHIAYDIGTREIAEQMASKSGYLAILGGVSRLVVDLNRYSTEESVIPPRSDGVEITNNILDEAGRIQRIQRLYDPYHDRLSQLIKDLQPRLLLSLHSFTPTLRTNTQIDRPWDIGVLYNQYEAASRMALQFLEEEDLKVGDQLPYSGRELNATMNRQAESVGQPYFGVEIRQDLIAHEKGQLRFSEILQKTCDRILSGLA